MAAAGRLIGRAADAPGAPLAQLIRADQLTAVRRAVLLSMPVNTLLGASAALIAWHSGQAVAGLIWFATSSVVNAVRILLCRLPETTEPAAVDRRLTLYSVFALLSGVVWAFIPVLCEGYTSPQTLFYLTVVCGITAGAVTHGFAYARIPICFITPPLLSVAGCLFVAGGIERICLAATVLLYLAALIRAALDSESQMRESIRLKNEATFLVSSLESAHETATRIAEEMTRRASHDALTGLLNRSGFMEDADRRARIAQSPLCLLLLDLDGFKAVNDAYGHQAGDEVLIEVARRLRLALPNAFSVARLGGDEFTVLFETDLVETKPDRLAENLIAAISMPFAAFDAGRIGLSIGVAVAVSPSIEDMLLAADAALYAAKSAGRNSFYLFDDKLDHHLSMRRDIERDLARALAEGVLEVWYQPVMIEGGARFGGFEALTRWLHPRHGWIAPPDLFACASLAGLGEPLMRYVLADVCRVIRGVQKLDVQGARVAMNVSPREMSQIAVDELVLGELRRQMLPPSTLEIEITEETALDIEVVRDKLTALSDAGVNIAIDDFGVGYSSLGALRRLRVDRVKIDRSFVDGVARSAERRSLVQAILSLSGPLGFDVVAEGIEQPEDLRALQELGCPAMQGHLLGRPMPRDEALDWARAYSQSTPRTVWRGR